MTPSRPRYRAVLSRPELAYLLAVVSAGPVVGLDNPRVAGSRAEVGLERLVANGRLTADGAGWNLDNRLALMVATMASPERTMMVTRIIDGDRQRRQVVTYYAAGELLVEQFRIDDPGGHGDRANDDGEPGDHYVIAGLAGDDEMIEHIIGAVPAPAEGTVAVWGMAAADESAAAGRTVQVADDGFAAAVAAEPTVRLAGDRFAGAVGAEPPARRRSLLQGLLMDAGVAREPATAWARAIRPDGSDLMVEAAAFAGRRVVARRDLRWFEVSVPVPEPVVVADDGDGTSVTVGPGHPATVTRLLQPIWQGLSKARAEFLDNRSLFVATGPRSDRSDRS